VDDLKMQFLIELTKLLTAIITLVAAALTLIGARKTEKPTTTNAEQSKRDSEPPDKGG
jgi:hypothetical protein